MRTLLALALLVMSAAADTTAPTPGATLERAPPIAPGGLAHLGEPSLDAAWMVRGGSGMARILERSSFAFMKQHEDKFDHTNELLWEQSVKPGSFLRKGNTGDGRKGLSTEQHDSFDAQYQKKLRKVQTP